MMSSNEKYQEFIIPKLQEFWKAHREDYVRSGLEDGLFLPHVFDKYDDCQKKIFYIGQDAPYWRPSSQMIELFDADEYKKYIEENNGVMRPIAKRLAWGNSPSAFWTMVSKLHIYLYTGEWKQDITKLSKEERDILRTLGYGNINSIPLRQTITTYEDWSKIKFEYYIKTKIALFTIEELRHIVSAYDPDIIIVLTKLVSAEKVEQLLTGIDVKWKSNDEVSDELSVDVGKFCINNKIRTIIWTNNPNYFRFIGTNMYEVSSLIQKEINLINGFKGYIYK